MNIPSIFFGVLFTIGGLLFAMGKLHKHLSSWKNTPDEEKRKIKIVPLCRNIGAVIALCGIIFLVKGFTTVLSGRRFLFAMIAWLIIAGIDAWRISKSKRYQSK